MLDEDGCSFDRIKVGDADSSGRKVEQIVYYQKGKYLIYFVEGDYLRPYYVDDYDFNGKLSSEFQILVSSIRCIKLKNTKKNGYVRQEIASAYYNAVNKYNEVALGELKCLKNRLQYGCYVKWILAYAVCNLLLITSCGCMSVLYSQSSLNEMLYCITSSCIGSFLVYSKKRSEAFISNYLPTIDAVITFFSSAISGFLVYCILKSDLLLGSFSDTIFGIILIGFIAGYSEDIPLKLLSGLSNMAVGQRGEVKKE